MTVPMTVSPLTMPSFHPASAMGEYEMQMQQMYQLQHLQQALPAQQMHLHHAPQTAAAGVTAQTKYKRQGKRQKKTPSREVQGATPQKVNSQESPDCAPLPGNYFGDEQKQMLLEAVKSLYKDQIMPHHMLVLRRFQENYGERLSAQQLRHLCLEIPEIQVVATGELKHFDVMLHDPPEGFEMFVDQLSPEDSYPPELWLQVQAFLEDEAQKPQTGWPGSRYEFAKWMKSHLNCLAEYSLGQICHLVQMSISHRQLLGYRQGNIVSYELSDDCKKKSNAWLNVPTQILPGEMYVQTWKQAGELIADLLEQNGGTVQLSSLKKMCRKEHNVELSESALGHAKLSEFLKDHRLKSPSGGSFDLEQNSTGCVVVHRKPPKQKRKGNKASSFNGRNSPCTSTSTDSDSKSTAASNDGSPKVQMQPSPWVSPPPGLELPEALPMDSNPCYVQMDEAHADMHSLYMLDTILSSLYAKQSFLPVHGGCHGQYPYPDLKF
jgi:hypothetical protein